MAATDPAGDDAEVVWKACLRATGERMVLYRGYENPTASDLAGAFRLTGGFVAFATRASTDTAQGEVTTLRLVDLNRRRRTLAQPAGDLTALKLSPRGALAWREDDGMRTLLYLHDRSGTHKVDSGPSRAIIRIHFTRSRLAWHNGNVAHSNPVA
jgi:hypothetical protein